MSASRACRSSQTAASSAAASRRPGNTTCTCTCGARPRTSSCTGRPGSTRSACAGFTACEGVSVSEQETPEAFRERARAWVEQNLPRADAQASGGLAADDEEELRGVAEARALQKKIFDAGFAGIRYPKEYGGQGLTREHQLAWHEATAGYRVPTAFSVTHGILGPTMLDFGTEEQKAQ